MVCVPDTFLGAGEPAVRQRPVILKEPRPGEGSRQTHEQSTEYAQCQKVIRALEKNKAREEGQRAKQGAILY